MIHNRKGSCFIWPGFILAIGLFFHSLVLADIAVITNPATEIDSLTVKQIKSIFMVRNKKFPDGNSVIPVDQNAKNLIRIHFNKQILGRSESQIRAYWGKMIFSGKKKPPRIVGDDKEVKAYVSSTIGSLGYIDSSSIDDSVKVLLRVK
ncbi:MAG: phosphate ABC transporter substrate-binding protein [Gammaproteobacteria bacterium]|nr:phosphate ABC transporter substrate-binding protein [Gammaproteobacteria bacterium]